jgi:hypothetical protein
MSRGVVDQPRHLLGEAGVAGDSLESGLQLIGIDNRRVVPELIDHRIRLRGEEDGQSGQRPFAPIEGEQADARILQRRLEPPQGGLT